MIIKKEKYYLKIINRRGRYIYDTQRVKRTSYLLLGILPLYIKHEVISGSYER